VNASQLVLFVLFVPPPLNDLVDEEVPLREGSMSLPLNPAALECLNEALSEFRHIGISFRVYAKVLSCHAIHMCMHGQGSVLQPSLQVPRVLPMAIHSPGSP